MTIKYSLQTLFIQLNWPRIIAWMPVILLAARIVLGLLGPGTSFLDGNDIGLYWLYYSGWQISAFTAMGMVTTALFGLIVSLDQLLLRQRLADLDWLLALANITIVVFFWLLSLSSFSPVPFVAHVAEIRTQGHVFYLAREALIPGNQDCLPDNCFSHVYRVFECDAWGIVCHRVYLSQQYPMFGSNGGRPEHLPRLALRIDDAGAVQLVDGDAILWQSP